MEEFLSRFSLFIITSWSFSIFLQLPFVNPWKIEKSEWIDYITTHIALVVEKKRIGVGGPIFAHPFKQTTRYIVDLFNIKFCESLYFANCANPPNNFS